MEENTRKQTRHNEMKNTQTAASLRPHALSVNSSVSKHLSFNQTQEEYSNSEMCVHKIWIIGSTVVTPLAPGGSH